MLGKVGYGSYLAHMAKETLIYFLQVVTTKAYILLAIQGPKLDYTQP